MSNFFKLSHDVVGEPIGQCNQTFGFKLRVLNRPLVKLFAITCFLIFNVNLSVSSSFAQDAGNTASLNIEVYDDMDNKRGSRYLVHHYADQQCAKPKRKYKLLEKRGVQGSYTFKTVNVDAQESFVFQVSYEQKKLRHLKSCSSIASLNLTAGHDYRVIYKVRGEVLGCSIQIFDLSADPSEAQALASSSEADGSDSQQNSAPGTNGLVEVDFVKPELVCIKVGKQGYKNNVPVHAQRDF